jgi:hypothetical protein
LFSASVDPAVDPAPLINEPQMQELVYRLPAGTVGTRPNIVQDVDVQHISTGRAQVEPVCVRP